MAIKIISGILILVTAFFSFKHGWAALSMKQQESGMMAALGISKPILYIIGSLTFIVGLLVLFPATFFVGCLLNAILILLMLGLQLKAGNMKAALIEIPFLLMPLVMIYLDHPFKK